MQAVGQVSAVPFVPDMRGALLESIKTKQNLKTPNIVPKTVEPRGDLLSEIQGGFKLKPACDRLSSKSDDATGTDALANALKKVLNEREQKFRNPVSSDEDSNAVSDDDDDDDWE